jgi:hypothetical protein
MRARPIELARDIIEQQDRANSTRTLDDFDLSQVERDDHRSLLALRGHPPNAYPIEFENEIVAMGADGRRTACSIAGPVALEFCAKGFWWLRGTALVSSPQRERRLADTGEGSLERSCELFGGPLAGCAERQAVLHHEILP